MRTGSTGAAMAALLLLGACGAGSPDDPSVATSAAATTHAQAGPAALTMTPAPTARPAPAALPAAPTAEGLWIGRTNTNRAITGLILDDDSFYIVYSRVGNAAAIGGVVQGSGTSKNSGLWSGDGRDFSFEGAGVLAATVSIGYEAREAVHGTLTYRAGAPVSFNGAFDAAYDTIPSLAALAGTFAGQAIFAHGAENATVTVSAQGTLTTAVAGGCRLSGSVVPRARGNVFNISLTTGGASCLFAQQTLTGIAYFDAGLQRMYAVARNAVGSGSTVFIGVKP